MKEKDIKKFFEHILNSPAEYNIKEHSPTHNLLIGPGIYAIIAKDIKNIIKN